VSWIRTNVEQKGFGEERPTLQKELEEYFSKYGLVRSVRMRRQDDTKQFKVRSSRVDAQCCS
jgi:lupus La protein